MKEDKLRSLWQQAVGNAEISIQSDRLVDSLTKARRAEQLRRAYEFSDLIGGVAVMVVFIMLAVTKPELARDLFPLGTIGGILVLAAFGAFHVRSFLIRRLSPAEDSTLLQYLLVEREKLEKRIAFLSSFLWYVLFGTLGFFLFFASIFGSIEAGFIILAFLGVFVAAVLYMNSRNRKKDFVPLRDEIIDLIAQLQNGSW